MRCGFVAPGNQKTALTTLGVLDRFVERVDRADGLKAEHRVGARPLRFRHVSRELESHGDGDFAERCLTRAFQREIGFDR